MVIWVVWERGLENERWGNIRGGVFNRGFEEIFGGRFIICGGGVYLILGW